jgi:hypothetical protein
MDFRQFSARLLRFVCRMSHGLGTLPSMKKLLRLRFPVVLIVALPLLYVGSFFAWAAIDCHVIDIVTSRRTGFRPIEWMIDETVFGDYATAVGDAKSQWYLSYESSLRHPVVLVWPPDVPDRPL